MIKIKICVGSSCYLKGAQGIVDRLQLIIKEKELKGLVDLSGAFCLGNCGDGIAISINDQIIHVSSVDEAEKLFYETIEG